MPIYEFRCDSCQHVFEELQMFSDPDPEACPKCSAASVRRMISNSTFHLKGSGWYATDNKVSSGSSSSGAGAGDGSSA